jgi:hypothetical protein
MCRSVNRDQSFRGIYCTHLQGAPKMKAAASYNINNRYCENFSCLGLLDLGEGRGNSMAVQQIVTCKFLTLVLYFSIHKVLLLYHQYFKEARPFVRYPFSSSGETIHLSALAGSFRNVAFVLFFRQKNSLPMLVKLLVSKIADFVNILQKR